MRRQRVLFTIVGFSVCMVLVYAGLHGRLVQLRRFSQDVIVVTTARELQAGVVLSPEDVTQTRVPVTSLSRGQFHDKSEVLGKPTIAPIAKGNILVAADLGGECNPVPQRPSMRAVTVQIQRGTDSPDLHIGDQVDVLIVWRSPDYTRVVTLLKRVTLLGITRNFGRQLNVGELMPASVALLVTPEDALRIAAAKAKGQLEVAISGAKPF